MTMKCIICERFFSRPDNLQRHIKCVHKLLESKNIGNSSNRIQYYNNEKDIPADENIAKNKLYALKPGLSKDREAEEETEDEDEKLLKNIIKARKAIKEKYLSLKRNRADTETMLEKTFKPITNSLKELGENTKSAIIKTNNRNDLDTPFKPKRAKIEDTSTPFKAIDTVGDEFETTSHSVKDCFVSLDGTLDKTPAASSTSFQNSPNRIIANLNLREDEVDYKYGPHLDPEENVWKIGNSPFEMDEKNIVVKDKTYLLTPGLIQLLFVKNPNKKLYTEEDVKNYVNIISQTQAIKRNYDEKEKISGTRSTKYKLIKKFLTAHTGSGLVQSPRYKFDNVYWNNPNQYKKQGAAKHKSYALKRFLSKEKEEEEEKIGNNDKRSEEGEEDRNEESEEGEGEEEEDEEEIEGTEEEEDSDEGSKEREEEDEEDEETGEEGEEICVCGDPNVLVERLKKLIKPNDGRKIFPIVEELRRRNIIE